MAALQGKSMGRCLVTGGLFERGPEPPDERRHAEVLFCCPDSCAVSPMLALALRIFV
jgi:hypothetical protein